MKNLSLLLIGFLLCLVVRAQEPLSIQYNQKQFNAHPYMWDAAEDIYGRIYFANNQGVVRFDGHHWTTFKTPNPVRHLCFGKHAEIYVACLGDFGVIQFTPNGNYTYTSLRKQLPAKNQQTGGNEQVFLIGNSIYFYMANQLVQIEKNENNFSSKIFEIGNSNGAFTHQGKLYINTEDNGLGTFERGKINIIAGGEQLAKNYLSSVAKNKSQLYVCGSKGNVFTLNQNQLVKNPQLNGNGAISMCCLPNDNLLIAYINEGVTRYFTKQNATEKVQLPSKEMYMVYTDKEGNVWSAHSKGLTHTLLSLPINSIELSGISGNITDVLLQEETLYISTTAGLYKTQARKRSKLEKIDGINAECWDLTSANNQIYIASTDGLYAYQNNQVKILLPGETLMHLQMGNISNSLYALGETGTWKVFSNNETSLLKEVPGLATSLLEDEHGIKWVGTYQRGLVQLSNNPASFTDSSLVEGKVNLRLWDGKIYIQQNNKLYLYNKQANEIIEDAGENTLLQNIKNKETMFETNGILYTDEGMKVFDNRQLKPQSIIYCAGGKISAAIRLNQEYWLASDDQIYYIKDGVLPNEAPKFSFNQLVYGKGNLGFAGFFTEENGSISEQQLYTPEIDFEALPIQIEFGLNSLVNPEQQWFSYQIEGINAGWSEWQKSASVSLQGLSGGTYTLHVKAKDSFGKETLGSFKFYIKSPWYLSAMAFLVYIIVFCLFIYFLLFLNQRRLISKNRELEIKVNERTKELTEEKTKSDNLLLNILPLEVAEELKRTGSLEAKQFDDVSVLFTDFVGFTSISERLSPKELVEEIHYCFKAFDEIIEKNQLEKIKTIGDAYMAVGGMPNKDSKHAVKSVQAAIDIHKFIRQYQIDRKAANKPYFEIRMGINSGSVIAGIVGVKKFAYDIWGDTVNTAARMEQNCEPGKINISGPTYQLVKSQFTCVHRGAIEAKNKGAIDMYYVETK
jgi:class 3 adenylate cyclase/ligand-binding sensor domain-containing protein